MTNPPRDNVGPRQVVTGTAAVRGRVVDDTGMAITGATVAIRIPGPDLESSESTTDAEGRYEVRDLPAGTLLVQASRTGYVARNPNLPTIRSVRLDAGKVTAAPDLVLVRPGVIVGHLIGPDGKPLVRARVQALRDRRMGSVRRRMPVGSAESDDRGAFRLHSLSPGEYYVLVNPPFQPLQAKKASAPGDMAPTFYPGTVDPSEARTIAVSSGGETPVSWSALPSALYSVSGRVVDAQGKPFTSVYVSLRRLGDVEMELMYGVSGPPTQDGTFTIRRVPPGTYRAVGREARQGPPRGATANGPLRMGSTDVVVGADIEDLVVRMAEGATVRGRVTFASPLPDGPKDLQLFWSPLDPMISGGSTGPTRIGDDGTFQVTGARGAIHFRLGVGAAAGAGSGSTAQAPGAPSAGRAPPGMAGPTERPWPPTPSTSRYGPWRVRSVRAGARDVTDGLPVGYEGLVEGVEIEAVRDFAMIWGVVRATSGPIDDVSVIMVPAEDTRRLVSAGLAVAGRTRPSADGRYVFPGVLPGTYDLLAVPGDEPFSADDEGVFQQWDGHPTRVTIGPNQSLEMNLELAKRK